jgi:nitroimidazol reductase NimA-like FMN-containing flavoprotein (pyridoxamine 5'-phosphate oxidase superfamily)
MDIIRTEPSIEFTVYKDYSYIPSYFLDTVIACSASQLYKSVMIFGKAKIVEPMEEKINVLNEMMRIFQPEGQYEKIEKEKHEYQNILERTAIIKIEITNMTAKFKFGQQLSEGKIRLIINNLKKSENPIDQETVVLMEKYWKMYWKKDK